MITQVFLMSMFLCSLLLTGTLNDPVNMNQSNASSVNTMQNVEVVILGGGCFWCIEAIFEELEGVKQVESGYSGGWVDDPTYQQVCTGETGHAEVVQIIFDPKIISLKEILRVFFTVHDPTTLNRQGADVGTQYRSVIFYRNQEQRAVAGDVIQEIQTAKLWNASVVTEIVPFKAFYKAEDYHQKYYKMNPEQAYCRILIDPKIRKFRELYRNKLKRK